MIRQSALVYKGRHLYQQGIKPSAIQEKRSIICLALTMVGAPGQLAGTKGAMSATGLRILPGAREARASHQISWCREVCPTAQAQHLQNNGGTYVTNKSCQPSKRGIDILDNYKPFHTTPEHTYRFWLSQCRQMGVAGGNKQHCRVSAVTTYCAVFIMHNCNTERGRTNIGSLSQPLLG